MAGEQRISRKVTACATCDYWSSEMRAADKDNEQDQEIIYESFQRAECLQGLHSGVATAPLFRCHTWKLWQKVAFAKSTDTSQKEGFTSKQRNMVELARSRVLARITADREVKEKIRNEREE